MIYSYPFFSFPNSRKYSNYYDTTRMNTYSNMSYNVFKRNYINKQYEKQINEALILKNKDDNSYKENEINKNTKYNKNNESIVNKRSSNNRTPNGFSFLNNFLNQDDRDDDEEYFEFFGLKLYNDDLLLLGLIFFLYKEDVKDQYLFFALILLLLS